jgi:hypothetical protein
VSGGSWQYEQAGDHLLGENPAAYRERVPDLFTIAEGALYLRNDRQRVELCWRGDLAVIGHSDSDEQNLECAITATSLDRSESIAESELLAWTCFCCGVSLGRFKRIMHIRREVAFEIFRRIIAENQRPETNLDEALVWMEVDAD